MKSRDWRNPTSYGPSKTIPGQSLYPADLLKRHLAGTLPDIDHSQKYEYHYDENGEQIAEPLPLEMFELHNLAVALRKKQFEAATKHRAAQAQKERDSIIEQYKSSLKTTEPVPTNPPTTPTPSGESKKAG